ncbi:MAG: flippase-like domain-containing protein [Gammaproteobacteria bacterium]|nr:flippase-like domain-containing protein [Gammaproteobacteria bacterium]
MHDKVRRLSHAALARVEFDREQFKRWTERLGAVLIPGGVVALLYWAAHARPLPLREGWDLSLVGGLLLSLISFVAYSMRFRLALRIAGAPIGITAAVKLNALTMFYRFFIPLALGAELTRYLKLRGLLPTAGTRVMVTGIALDHVLGTLTLLAISSTLMIALRPFHLQFEWSTLGLLVLGLSLFIVYGARRFHLPTKKIVSAWLALARQHRGELSAALLWSLLTQVLLAAAVFVGSHGWGVAIDYWQILLVLTGSFLLQLVPVNLVGIGAADLAGTGLYVALGLSGADALLLASLMYCYRIVIAVIGGLWDWFVGTARV